MYTECLIVHFQEQLQWRILKFLKTKKNQNSGEFQTKMKDHVQNLEDGKLKKRIIKIIGQEIVNVSELSK